MTPFVLRSACAVWVGLVSGTVSLAADTLATEARAALAKATAAMQGIATEGGYLWRYSPDLSARAGEN